MVRFPFLLPFLCFNLVSVFLFSSDAWTDTPKKDSDAYFKDTDVVHLEIEIAKGEVDSLNRDPRNYVKAILKENPQKKGKKIEGKKVGVHLRGSAGSFRGLDEKPGLTINMDKYVDGQLFHGMDKFHLCNSLQDPSYVYEFICGELCRGVGVPASRIQFATLTLNGKKKGLYYLKEGYDSLFLKEHFGSNKGNFYDGGFLRDIDSDLQLISTKQDVKDQADRKALLEATKEPKLEDRFKKLEAVLDLDKFISFMAIEAFMWDWDGYPMNRNNYRIYHDPKSGKMIFIPSGMDQMFGDTQGPILPEFQGIVARALIQTPQAKQRYFKRLREIVSKELKLDTIGKRLEELENRLTPVLSSIDKDAGKDLKNRIKQVKESIEARAKSVEEQLNKMKK